MRLFAISDLHLSLQAPYLPGSPGPPPLAKPMDVFGPAWQDGFRRLEQAWLERVAADDVVLLPGDISWALTLEEAAHDLAYIQALPGRKVMIKGNHDYWWSSLSQVRRALGPQTTALQHGAIKTGPWVVAGTRGWLIPNSREYKDSQDARLYRRELLRLDMALAEADALGGADICLLHYPPLLPEGESEFSRLLEERQVKLCLYGHVHGNRSPAFEGERNGVSYINVSMDRLAFAPRLIGESPPA